MATIHFIGGEKGGVGKSLLARLMAQYLIDRSLPFLGFDSDRSHGALLRFYAGYASPVVIDHYDSLDKVVEAAAEVPQRRILVDLAAQTHAPLVRWMEESGMLELAREMEIGVRYWHVMDSGRDSVDLLARLLDRFGERLDYTLVLNQLRGDDFGILEQSGQKARALSLGARIVTLPRLHEGAMTRIDARSTSFWAAANSGDKEVTGLGLLERQRVRVWLAKAYAELERAGV
ncbi:MAG TPA: mobilization protein [Solimonas sp.]|nr:mobilization protein [Solimonas sp.]